MFHSKIGGHVLMPIFDTCQGRHQEEKKVVNTVKQEAMARRIGR